jgi:hypothetical protein
MIEPIQLEPLRGNESNTIGGELVLKEVLDKNNNFGALI